MRHICVLLLLAGLAAADLSEHAAEKHAKEGRKVVVSEKKYSRKESSSKRDEGKKGTDDVDRDGTGHYHAPPYDGYHAGPPSGFYYPLTPPPKPYHSSSYSHFNLGGTSLLGGGSGYDESVLAYEPGHSYDHHEFYPEHHHPEHHDIDVLSGPHGYAHPVDHHGYGHQEHHFVGHGGPSGPGAITVHKKEPDLYNLAPLLFLAFAVGLVAALLFFVADVSTARSLSTGLWTKATDFVHSHLGVHSTEYNMLDTVLLALEKYDVSPCYLSELTKRQDYPVAEGLGRAVMNQSQLFNKYLTAHCPHHLHDNLI